MPKLSNTEITDLTSDNEVNVTSEKRIISPFSSNRNGTNRVWEYPQISDDNGKTFRDMNSDEKQSFRAKGRREEKKQVRIANGETIRERGTNLTPEQKLTAKRSRREVRQDVRNLAFVQLTQERLGRENVSEKEVNETYESLRDTVINEYRKK